MLTCIYLCRTLLFFAPYADFFNKNEKFLKNNGKQIAVNTIRQELTDIAKECDFKNPRGKKRK